MSRALIIVLAAAACASPSAPITSAPSPSAPPAAAVGSMPPDAAVAAAAPTSADIVLVTDPAALAVVEDAGGSFGALLGGPGFATATLRRLAAESRYQIIARVLRADLAETARRDPEAGVGIRGHAHRLFDAGWLDGERARFELVGVVNRLDRAPFDGERCGEARLVYRLAYTATVAGERVSSRLPMTLVIALAGEPAAEGCRATATRWQAPVGTGGAALGRWLIGEAGPLSPRALRHAEVARVEVNLQSARWPSAVRPDLGGHAEYVMRVFRAAPRPTGEPVPPLVVDHLLDTPDVDRIRRDRALRQQLRAWIADNVTAIDDGSAILPPALSATRALSVTPRGLARLANRPYRQIFAATDLASIDLSTARLVRSPEALLRRLDDLTCQGCHQGRTIAGFHLLGDDDGEVGVGNALAVSASVHLLAELDRRAALNRAVASGGRGDFARPFAERAPSDRGGYGAHCGLGDPGFASWSCAPGLRCDRHDAAPGDAVVGICVPEAAQVGDPCEVGAIAPHRDPHRDRVLRPAARACSSGAVCNTNAVGFPGGMCTEDCDELSPQGACGAIAQLRPFNDCLARQTPFPRCLAEHVDAAGLRACDAATPCRDDYVCTRGPAGGACIPPYFLFQLRVDGHPPGK